MWLSCSNSESWPRRSRCRVFVVTHRRVQDADAAAAAASIAVVSAPPPPALPPPEDTGGFSVGRVAHYTVVFIASFIVGFLKGAAVGALLVVAGNYRAAQVYLLPGAEQRSGKVPVCEVWGSTAANATSPVAHYLPRARNLPDSEYARCQLTCIF